MSLKYVLRKDIDIEKYNECITASSQSLIYGYSWYLDIVCDNWDALVLDDYKAVMPIPWRKKYLIKYVYQPFWTLQLGVFSQVENVELGFISFLKNEFKSIEIRLNSNNILPNSNDLISKKFQTLSLLENYTLTEDLFKNDRKKDLKRANRAKLTPLWNDNPENLISLFKNNIGKRTTYLMNEDYLKLSNLIDLCIHKGVGEVLSIYDDKNQLVASAFLIKHQKEITIICSSTDFENRKNGANTYLIKTAIEKYISNYNTFNFGGSSIESIAKYFTSFGSKNINYSLLKINNLPGVLRFLKS